MDIEEAASTLRDRLSDASWVTGVGFGEHDNRPCIFLYVKSPKRDEVRFLEDGWQGFPVEVRRMGSPRLAIDLGQSLAGTDIWNQAG